MPQILAEVKIHKISGIPADDVVNTFAFATSAAADATAATAIETQLRDFYNGVTGSFQPVIGWMASSVAAAAFDINFYDISGHLAGGAHGAPFATGTIPQTVTLGSDALPDELACALSFRSSYGTDPEFGPGRTTRPRARDRGRVFIGPLRKSAVNDLATTNEGAVFGGVCQSLVAAGDRLKGDATYTWSVWSRTKATLEAVTNVWCDNAFDVQRRRGIKPTARFAF